LVTRRGVTAGVIEAACPGLASTAGLSQTFRKKERRLGRTTQAGESQLPSFPVSSSSPDDAPRNS
jgi:hypothetical protein